MPSKKDPEVIRVGDRVKIINPEVFLRCGYPLSVETETEEIKKLFGVTIEDLVYSCTSDHFMQRNEKGLYENNLAIPITPNTVQLGAFNKIAKALGYVRVKAKKFGGNERKIFTEIHDELKGKEGRVEKTKFVRTGVYVRGSGYSDDYERPYLSEEKLHKILTLALFDSKESNPEIFMYEPVKIEVIHVKKIKNNEELDFTEK